MVFLLIFILPFMSLFENISEMHKIENFNVNNSFSKNQKGYPNYLFQLTVTCQPPTPPSLHFLLYCDCILKVNIDLEWELKLEKLNDETVGEGLY